MQQKYVSQKKSQNRRLLLEALVEENSPSHSDLKMTSRGPVTQKMAPGAKETTYWDDNRRERWLPWTGYLVPMRTSRFKKKPHMIRMFVHDRVETSLSKHPSLDTQPSSTGRPLMGDPSSGWLLWSTGSLRRNHLSGPSTATLLAWVALSPSKGQSRGL
ncbi:hypothetical protein E2C01_098562 [Portunus trituberculatus]|uniref:Uncharacterized protein n=1 Tax=Portunus trituberculatus TaxID=210409 RepID=A0A5B7K3A4_PORTR|nr:hypothetical protein [Portunus trituberculatus]